MNEITEDTQFRMPQLRILSIGFLKFIWETERQRDLPFSCQFPKYPQQIIYGQAESRSWELKPGLPHMWQQSAYVKHYLLTQQVHFSQNLELEADSQFYRFCMSGAFSSVFWSFPGIANDPVLPDWEAAMQAAPGSTLAMKGNNWDSTVYCVAKWSYVIA